MSEKKLQDEIKQWLYEHLIDLDFHSVRESNKCERWKWNTPIMNEFIAFGKICYNIGYIRGKNRSSLSTTTEKEKVK